MKILIACDKFKGSMTAGEACRAIANGLGPHAGEIRQIPVADGGDGMAAALTESGGGQWFQREVHGPLGHPVQAGYGIIDQGLTAVIEMAEASGLSRMGRFPNDPWSASTYGTGQLIRDAVTRGVKKILLGIGGSATNDGGTGMAEALGYRFISGTGKRLSNLPVILEEVVRIEPREEVENLPEVVVACDVTNPLLGGNGCTRIYGPQKGIRESDFESHERRLEHLIRLTGGQKFSQVPGSGAAGGLGFGALVFLHASLESGFDMIAKVLDLESAIAWADIVITGEGKIDQQSLQGKAPAGVARLAKIRGKTVVGFCGVLGKGEVENTFDRIWEIDRGGLSVADAMKEGRRLLEKTAQAARTTLKDLIR